MDAPERRQGGGSWPGWLPVAVLGGAALLYFREAVFTDRTFYFRDVTTFIVPTRRLIRELVWTGEWPLWNPFLAGGAPLWANVELNLLYPASALYYLLPFDAGFKLFVLLHYPLAGGAMYALGRGWGLGRWAAAFAGLAYMLSGPLLSLASVVNYLPGMAWLPVALLGLSRALRGPVWPGVAVAGGAVALQALTDPQVAYLTGVALAGYALGDPEGTGRVGRRLGLAALVGGLGGLLAAIQLVPLAELYLQSVRAGGVEAAEATVSTLGASRLLELLLPRLYGDPTAWTYWAGLPRGELTPWLLSPYVGVATLVAAGCALGLGPGRRRAWTVAGLGVLGAVLAMGDATPAYGLAARWVPLFGAFRYPDKWWLLTTLALVGLAGLGVDALAREEGRRWRRVVAAAATALGLLLLSAAVLLLVRPDLVTGLPAFPAGDRRVLVPFVAGRAVEQGLVAATLLLASALLLVLAERGGRGTGLAPCGLAVLLLGDLAVSQARLVPLAPPALHRAPSPAGQLLGATAPGTRKATLTWEWDRLPWGSGPAASGAGYHRWLVESLYPDTGLRYGLAEHFAETSARLRDYERLRRAFLARGRWRDHLVLWSVPLVLAIQAQARPGLEPLGEIALEPGPPVRLYRVPDALPRARVVGRARRLGDREAILRALAEGREDPREVVLLEGEDGEETSGEGGRAAIVRQGPNELEIAVDGHGGWLVLAETWYPGWRAWVDGRPAGLERANYAQRAVRVVAGSHRVRLAYRPWSVATGAAVSAASVAGLLVIAIRRGRRPASG